MPEELVKPEELSKYRQVASHVVSAAVLSKTHPLLLGSVQTHSSAASQSQGGRGSLRGDQCWSGGGTGFQQSPLQDPLGFPLGHFPACGTNLASFCLAQGLHSASIPGILALDLCPSDTNKILTGKGAISALWGLWCQQRSFSCLGMGPFL